MERNPLSSSSRFGEMNTMRWVALRACLFSLVAASFNAPANAANRQEQPQSVTVAFFDVPDLPARVDEPKLRKSDQGFVLDCAMANRSGEQLLGLRLIILVVDHSGKLRSRITWTEESELPSYSIKAFAFHPIMKGELRSTDQIYLEIDEVIGHETIWRAVGAEKALRAYSRGQPGGMPEVQTMANKFDRSPDQFAPLRIRP
jgi:hypothetical protein